MREATRKALEYVSNTRGGATIENFIEDFAPIGEQLWRELRFPERLATVDRNGKIWLTEEGKKALME